MKTKKSTFFISILILSSMVLGACVAAETTTAEPPTVEPVVTEAPATEETQTDEGVTITDSSGNLVELAGLPQRVVVAGKATPFTLSTTYLFEEASERVVAQELRGLTIPEFLSLIDPMYEEKIKLDMDSGAEQIAPVKPDIVITKNFAVKGLQGPLGEIGIPVVGLDMENPEVFYKDIEMLGQLFGNPGRAAEINEYFQEKVAAVAQAMDGLMDEAKPSVLVIQYSESDGVAAFKVPPAGYIQTRMVIDGGGMPVWADGTDQGTDWVVVNLEQIAAWNPEIVLVIDYKTPQETVEKLKQDATWQELKAVQDQKVYAFGQDYQGWDVPDPRWILGYTWVAKMLQPERMADVDMDAMVREFFATMYGLTEEQIDTGVMPKVIAPVAVSP